VITVDSGKAPINPADKTIRRLLRDILIRHRPPVFDLALEKNMFNDFGEIDDVGVPGCDLLDLALEFTCLNPDQQAAVVKVGMTHKSNTSGYKFISHIFVVSHRWLQHSILR
jgi:hypothetical protein